MIGLSTKIFDSLGDESFPDSDIINLDNKVTRRVISTPTLDGGSYVSDQGYSDTDKRMNFDVLYLSKNRVENIIRIAKLHSKIFICSAEGAFLGTISQVYYKNGKMRINIVIIGEA